MAGPVPVVLLVEDEPAQREILGALGVYAPMGDSAALAQRVLEHGAFEIGDDLLQGALTRDRGRRRADLGEAQHEGAGIACQFVEVARPVMALDMAPLHLADGGHGKPQFAGVAGYEQAEDFGHILAPLGMAVDEFVRVCDQFTNKRIFKRDAEGRLLKDRFGNLTKLNYDNP